MPRVPTNGVPPVSPVGLSRRGFIGLALAGGAVTAAALAIPHCFEKQRAGMYMFQETHKVAPLTRHITARAQSRQEAVEMVVQWTQNNFFHAYCSQPDECWRYAGGGQSRTVSIEDVFRERAVGCHRASGVVITMLRSIGIYAEYVREKRGRFLDKGGHGVCHIPELKRYIHGDYIAELIAIPAHELLQTREELLKWSAQPGLKRRRDGAYAYRGFYGYMATLNEKYGFTHDGIRKRRQGNALYLSGYLSAVKRKIGLTQLAELAPAFVPHLGEEDRIGRIHFTTDRVPIQPLTW